MASLIVGGLFTSAFVDMLFDKTRSVLIQQYVLQFGLTDGLKMLQKALYKCRATLIRVECRTMLISTESRQISVESRQMDEEYLAELLRELKDAAYDADDLLDDFEYLHRQYQVVEDQNLTGDFFPFINIARYFFDQDDDEKIRGISSRLDQLSCYVGEVLGQIDLAHGVKRREITEREETSSSALGSCYQRLPAHLKQCSSYCSIFPKGYKFEKDSLVKMWMAQGFIKPQENKRVEDIGNEYFDELLHRSFFHCSEYIWYVMDDLVHDLVQSISVDDCFRIEKDRSGEIPKTVRHLSLCAKDLEVMDVWGLFKFKKLRTLAFFQAYKPEFNHVLQELLKELTSIRVLSLRDCGIKELPDSISNLKHLRYLDLSHTKIGRLPESLYSLYNLQVLNLGKCYLRPMRKGMSNLINLRHLEMDHDRLSLLSGIGKLTSLQKLEQFVVLNQDRHKIGELKDMNELRGRLCIVGLESIENKEEAKNAELNNKKHLDEIELRWYNSIYNGKITVKVLECLQPHPNLKKLIVKGYSGFKSPSWLENQLLSNLEEIYLEDCGRWEVLPPLGQLPFLKRLVFRKMNGVIRISDHFYGYGGGAGFKVFPTLEYLEFDGMSKWKEWSGPWAMQRQLFPRLKVLRITNCPKLRALHSLPLTHLVSLWKLVIKDCKELASLPVNEFRYLASLQELSVKDCPKLKSSVPEKEENGDILLPSSLLSLKVCLCNDLDRLLPRCLPNLTSLWFLKIDGCPHITSLPGEAVCHLTALERLYITDCKGITLLGGLQALSRLQELEIKNCPKLIVSWDEDEEEDCLSFLEYLKTDNRSLLTGGILQKFMPALQTMYIVNCAWLIRFTREQKQWLKKLVPLGYLKIMDCVNLQSLPVELQNLSSLSSLRLKGCPKIKSLQKKGLPMSLESLKIHGCPALQERCRKDEGPDWIKVAHIPDLRIQGESGSYEFYRRGEKL